MILYFSGTGNSTYIANKLAAELNDSVISMNEKIKHGDYREHYSETPYIIVAPTYAWKIPRIVEDYLNKTTFHGNQNVYFIMTCGGDIGNAGHNLKKLCKKINLVYQGVQGFLMPDNYIALYDTPNTEEAREMIEKILPSLNQSIETIRKQEPLIEKKTTLLDILKSSLINPIFYSMMVRTKKFWVQESCISCGLCAKECPLNNIQLQKNKPIWGTSCTHCMACISKCPVKAIEYGKHSANRNRYKCPM